MGNCAVYVYSCKVGVTAIVSWPYNAVRANRNWWSLPVSMQNNQPIQPSG